MITWNKWCVTNFTLAELGVILMDKLKSMAAFVCIAEQGSLTAASQVLGASLPTVVRTLAALEADLGVRLFNAARGASRSPMRACATWIAAAMCWRPWKRPNRRCAKTPGNSPPTDDHGAGAVRPDARGAVAESLCPAAPQGALQPGAGGPPGESAGRGHRSGRAHRPAQRFLARRASGRAGAAHGGRAACRPRASRRIPGPAAGQLHRLLRRRPFLVGLPE